MALWRARGVICGIGLKLFHWCFDKSGSIRPDFHARGMTETDNTIAALLVKCTDLMNTSNATPSMLIIARGIACDLVMLSMPTAIGGSTASGHHGVNDPIDATLSADEIVMSIKVAMRAAKAYAGTVHYSTISLTY
jgi:hypothetical protein